MRYALVSSIIAILMIVFILAFPMFANESGIFDAAEKLSTQSIENESFACFTYDDHGRILNAFWSDRDNTWYLCVTAVQSVENIKLHWTGDIVAASGGILNLEEATVTGGFTKAGDNLLMTQENGTVQKIVVLQSNLPSVYINLEGTTLADIHADKSIKHANNSIYIMDTKDNQNVAVVGTVEIKGRGNSSWREYEKKGYQIKFDSDVSVLGMEKAKKWVLLANASDDSLMRTQLVSRMAKNFDMEYVASFEYVDLWIDGEYLGTYLIGEKVEPGSSRLNLLNNSGALFEHDETFYLEEKNWFLSKKLNRHFTLKEIVEENASQIQLAMTDFEAAVDALIQYLYVTPSECVTLGDLAQMIDVDSFIKYFLINEYTLNRESFSTSFHWYKDGPKDVIHLGPIWDFDTCMGNDKEPYTATYGENHVMFRYLLAAPVFYERTMVLLEEYRDELESMTNDVEVLRARIEQSAKMNYLRWDVMGKANPKGGADFAPTFDAAVDVLQQWLRGREDGFRIECSKIATSVVSEDCRRITVNYQPEKDHESVMIALWSEENGNDDLSWYPAGKAEDGTWQCQINLENHNCAGLYYFNIYTDNQQTLLATGRNYVQTACSPQYDLKAEIVDDELVLMMNDTTGTLSSVRFDIWGASVQNTSFHRLQAEQNEQGIWMYKIPMCAFNLSGPDALIIQAYGMDQTMEMKLNEKQLSVEDVFAHAYPETEGGSCIDCGDVHGVDEFLAKTPIYHLYNSDTSEHFYTASAIERDILIAGEWQDEGISWCAPIFGGEPVYRLSKSDGVGRYYAQDSAETAKLEEAGWSLEGVCWTSYAGGVPVYRMSSQTISGHLYTADEAERDRLTALGWVCEGVVWYGAPDVSAQ